MSNYYIARSEDRLYFEHHGILGQKWGKKNGPPYPLDAGDHSSSERKAGWKASLKTGARVAGKATAAAGSVASTVATNNISKNASKEEKKAINSAANSLKESTQKVSSSIDNLTKDQVDLTKYSDEELRKIVNRLNMEQQYRNLTGSTSVKTGKDYVMGIMDVAIPVITSVGSAIILKKLKV